MNAVVSGVLSTGFAVVAFFTLRSLSSRFLNGPFRAEVAAAAVVLAFFIGFNWPRPRPNTEPPQGRANLTPQSEVTGMGGSCAAKYLTSTLGKGSLDTTEIVAGSLVVPAGFHYRLQTGDVVVAQGWAANAQLERPAAAVCIAIDKRILPGPTVRYGLSRPDVAAASHNDALESTGFEASVPAALVAPGRHRLQVVAIGADGAAALLPGGLWIAGPPGAYGSTLTGGEARAKLSKAIGGANVGSPLCRTAQLTPFAGKGSIDLVTVQSESAEPKPAAAQSILKRDDFIVFHGWAADSQLKRAAAAVCLAVDERIIPGVMLKLGLARPDVATAFHNDALTATGFELSFYGTSVRPGRHRLRVAVVSLDKKAALIAGGASVDRE